MADNVVQRTIIVPVEIGTKNKRTETFEFRIPTLHDEIAIGSRMTRIRQAADPLWDGFSVAIDGNAQFAMRACAAFEQLLDRSSVKWVFVEGPDKKPMVDSSKFPADKVPIIVRAYQGFQDSLTRFQQERLADDESIGAAPVESQPGSQ